MTMNLVGKTLGQYKLDQLIGEGGMATVYKAYQTSLNRPVAVKVLYYHEESSLARFEREAKAVASLRHRNILIVYEYGEADGLPFIAMEYVEGGTLEDRLNGKPMDWRRVVELTIPIAEALHYAHSQGIIHRDIKPSNILMPQEDWPVLADFGLVKHAEEQVGLTQTGTFMGTPSYIAPEQARDVALDFRADMYSLGVIMFEMITGRLPFDYESPNKILLAHVMEAPPSPRALNPLCPPALEQVILRALKKTANERYADMQEMVNALKDILATPQEQAETTVPKKEQTDEESAPRHTPQTKPEEAAGGIFGAFKKLFGRKPETREGDTASRTAPRPQVAMPENEAYDEAFDSTVQLDLRPSAAGVQPRLILQSKNITIELPNKNNIVVGRTYRDNVVDLDLEPHEASKYGVSRRHARFMRQGDLWLLEDLGSLNGTFINNIEVKQGSPMVLKDGDKIRFSHLNLIFIQA